MTVSGNEYEITLREGQYVADIARNFCISQAVSLGYTPTNPLTEQNIGGCVKPVQHIFKIQLQNTTQNFNKQHNHNHHLINSHQFH